MANAAKNRVLTRLLGKQIVFSGKFPWGERERMQALAEAQQATVTDEVTRATDYLVLADLAAGKTVQKKAATHNAKGATIQVLDQAAFKALAKPTDDEIMALMRGGKGNALLLAKCTNRDPRSSFDFELKGKNLDGFDLNGFDFSGLAFDHCSFVGANISSAVFGHAANCDFSQVEGASVQLSHVDLSRFNGARLQKAHIVSHTAGCDFSNAVLDGATISECFFGSWDTPQPATTGPSFRRATLRDARFEHVRVDGANFDSADLTGASFTSCQFTNLSFRNADLSNAVLVGVDLCKADFTLATLVNTNLGEADLTDACFDGADLIDCNVNGATVSGVDWSKARHKPPAPRVSTAGPALAELEKVAAVARHMRITFLVAASGTTREELAQITTYGGKHHHAHLYMPLTGRNHRPKPGQGLAGEMIQMANVIGRRAVRYETLEIKSTKSPMTGKMLRDLVLRAMAEAFAQPVPAEEELAKLTKAWRDEQSEKTAADRERRDAAKKAAEEAKARATKQIDRKVAKAVGKVTDIATFLKALELRADKQKIDKATKMLKAEKFKLFNDIGQEHLAGVVKSQTDPDLVYACRIDHDGQYACCTQNLNICGGLRGSICKHLLVLIIGLVKAGELDPTDIDAWIAKTHDVKPELDKEKMGEIFIRYKGAEAGEVDWRPTETVPEDYYAL